MRMDVLKRTIDSTADALSNMYESISRPTLFKLETSCLLVHTKKDLPWVVEFDRERLRAVLCRSLPQEESNGGKGSIVFEVLPPLPVDQK